MHPQDAPAEKGKENLCTTLYFPHYFRCLRRLTAHCKSSLSLERERMEKKKKKKVSSCNGLLISCMGRLGTRPTQLFSSPLDAFSSTFESLGPIYGIRRKGSCFNHAIISALRTAISHLYVLPRSYPENFFITSEVMRWENECGAISLLFLPLSLLARFS